MATLNCPVFSYRVPRSERAVASSLASFFVRRNDSAAAFTFGQVSFGRSIAITRNYALEKRLQLRPSAVAVRWA